MALVSKCIPKTSARAIAHLPARILADGRASSPSTDDVGPNRKIRERVDTTEREAYKFRQLDIFGRWIPQSREQPTQGRPRLFFVCGVLMTASPDLLTVREVALLYRVTPRSVRNWIKDGRLPAVRMSQRSVRIPRSAVFNVSSDPRRPSTGR